MDLKASKLMKFRIPRGYRGGHSIELLRSGKEFFSASEKVIDEARKFIHFQTYIVEDDDTGRRMIRALVRASERGVKIYLLLDAFGSRSFSKNLTAMIQDSGILFRRFSPGLMTKGFHMSLRLHHKILLADGNVAIIGGINVADRYRGTKAVKEWLDFAVTIRGPECAHALFIVKKLWNKTFISRKERSTETVHNPAVYEQGTKIRVLENNWYRNKIEILKSYRAAIRHSKHHLIIFGGYFLPGRNERKLLNNARKRGVDVTIVLTSASDTWLFSKATVFLYDFILRNRIRLYEYLPSMLHAKVATADGIWSTIGSYNMNHLSDYGSVEMNVDILDFGFSEYFQEVLLEIIKNDCREITEQELTRRKTWIFRFTGWISYQVIRFMMRMFLLTTRNSRPASI